MGIVTGVAWTHRTWNPWQGCYPDSPGCKYCYMFREKRAYGQDPYDIHLSSEQTFNQPLSKKWSTPARVFVCSWSDFFLPEADCWRPAAWEVVKKASHLTFQILTKRAHRISECLPEDWGDGYPNVWMGVTTENQQMLDKRLPYLREVPCRVRFISGEPLLEPLKMDLKGIHWVIIGAESGSNGSIPDDSRIMNPSWGSDMVRQCEEQGVAAFVKQLHLPTEKGNKLSKDINEWPEDLRVQEFPRDQAA